MSTYPGDGTLLAASTAASNVRTNYCYYYLYSNTVQYINDSFDICIPGESEFSEELWWEEQDYYEFGVNEMWQSGVVLSRL